MKHTNWYKDAVIYQIYPRSFCDGNGDGLGDIPGIISKLDYLKDLGVNCVWLSPVYDSPQKDNGYDIANYRDIYKPFGTLEDFKLMLDEMHKRGIRCIMDLVVNHTSDQHPWFQEALKDKNSPYRDYYFFRKGKRNGKKPPNNWSGFFAGSTWEKVPGSEDEYYLHLFTKEQPDLNWENPKVREEVIDILRYWLDMGVDGFRCDVITLISKKQDFKSRFPSLVLCGKDAFVNGPRLHEYLHLLYEKAYKDYDCMTVGETVMCDVKNTIALVDPAREELDMIFNFAHTDSDNYLGVKYLYRKPRLSILRSRLSKYQFALEGKGWNSLFIENHDQRRCVGRFGTDDKKYRVESAKMLGTMYFFLKGTPFIYQGQEIGMTNIGSTDINDYQDVELHNMYNWCQQNSFIKALIGKHMFDTSRDNARPPMQWNNGEFAGFSEVKPWFNVNKNKDEINVETALKDENSIYYYYKKLIEIRKNYPVVKEGKYTLHDKFNKWVYVYSRETNDSSLMVICNFKNKEVKNPRYKKLDGYELILSNYQDSKEETLRPYEARVYAKGK